MHCIYINTVYWTVCLFALMSQSKELEKLLNEIEKNSFCYSNAPSTTLVESITKRLLAFEKLFCLRTTNTLLRHGIKSLATFLPTHAFWQRKLVSSSWEGKKVVTSRFTSSLCFTSYLMFNSREPLRISKIQYWQVSCIDMDCILCAADTQAIWI